MRLSDFINNDMIFFDLKGKLKEEIIVEMAEKSFQGKYSSIKEEVELQILKKEMEYTFAVGNGVFLPNVRLSRFDDIIFTIGIIKEDVPCINLERKDDKLKVVFFVAAGEEKRDLMLKILASIKRIARDKKLVEKIASQSNGYEIIALIKSTGFDKSHHIKAEDIMKTDILPLNENDSIGVAAKRFAIEGVESLPITTSHGEFVGAISNLALISVGVPNYALYLNNLDFLTNDNVFESFFKREKELKVIQICEIDVVTVDKDTSVMELAFLMVSHKVHTIYVVEGKILKGVIYTKDIVERVLHI